MDKILDINLIWKRSDSSESLCLSTESEKRSMLPYIVYKKGTWQTFWMRLWEKWEWRGSVLSR